MSTAASRILSWALDRWWVAEGLLSRDVELFFAATRKKCRQRRPVDCVEQGIQGNIELYFSGKVDISGVVPLLQQFTGQREFTVSHQLIGYQEVP